MLITINIARKFKINYTRVRNEILQQNFEFITRNYSFTKPELFSVPLMFLTTSDLYTEGQYYQLFECSQ